MTAPVMWGGLAALLNFLPYIGPLAMMALLALFGLGTADALLVGLYPGRGLPGAARGRIERGHARRSWVRGSP